MNYYPNLNPPHAGWWFCKLTHVVEFCSFHEKYQRPYKYQECRWLWHDGDTWAGTSDNFPKLEYLDYCPSEDFTVEWSTYWPHDAETPRFNPDTGEMTGWGPIPMHMYTPYCEFLNRMFVGVSTSCMPKCR